MSDNYQAVYDAIRSRFHFDGQGLIDRIAQSFDASYMLPIIQQEFCIAAADLASPHAKMRPSISMDGDKWCALYGDNLQDGVAGFGDSPSKAMADFDLNWRKDIGDTTDTTSDAGHG